MFVKVCPRLESTFTKVFKYAIKKILKQFDNYK